jgi:hypothetical protein
MLAMFFSCFTISMRERYGHVFIDDDHLPNISSLDLSTKFIFDTSLIIVSNYNLFSE